jgi:hypothetical protein
LIRFGLVHVPDDDVHAHYELLLLYQMMHPLKDEQRLYLPGAEDLSFKHLVIFFHLLQELTALHPEKTKHEYAILQYMMCEK